MRLKILVSFAVLPLLFGGASRPEAVNWQIVPVVTEGVITGFDMALSFPGDQDGETVLRMPDDWGGERELYRGLWDIKAPGTELVAAETPGELVLRHKPGAQLTLNWKVGGGPDAPPAKQGGNDYRPRFTPDYMLVIGYTALPWPETVSNETPAHVVLERPDGITLISDLDHAAPSGRTTFGDLAQSVMFGGNIRIISAGSAHLAITGQFEETDDAFWQDTFTRIAAAERRYWKSKDQPFLVTVIAETYDPEVLSFGGTGLGDAFSIFAGANMPRTDVAPLIAHEMMHSWIPHKIGRMPEEDEARMYWLSEGFTEWSTFRLLTRAGIWSADDFAAAFNTSAEAFDMSSFREATADEISDGFWSNPDIGRLPYQKGLLIASWLDGQVRERTKGKRDLDDVLLAMQGAAKRQPDASAHDLLIKSVKKVARWDASVEIEAMAMQGGAVDLPADVFEPCGEITMSGRKMWERGFDFSATAANSWKIQGVAEGSRAYEAGLRNGMELRKWSESSDDRDPAKEATAGVTDGDGVKFITWLPEGQDVRQVRKLGLSSGASAQQEAACLKLLSGL